MKKWTFFSWNRDNHKAFANAVVSELEQKAPMEALDEKVSKTGDTISGVLSVGLPVGSGGTTYPLVIKGKYNNASYATEYVWRIGISTVAPLLYIRYGNQDIIGLGVPTALFPKIANLTLGAEYGRWANTYTKKINNGGDIEIPEKAGTMALVSDIEDILRKHGLIPAEETTEPTETEGEANAQ